MVTPNRLVQARPQDAVVVIEKEPEIVGHQSGHNSGIIHSGIFCELGSLKTKTAGWGVAP